MILTQLNLISPTLKQTASRTIRWTTIDTLLGAACGADFGGVFGGFEMLLRFEPSQIVSVAGYFALCGGATGALVGMYGGIVDDAEASETTSPSPLLRSTPFGTKQVPSVSETRRCQHNVNFKIVWSPIRVANDSQGRSPRHKNLRGTDCSR